MTHQTAIGPADFELLDAASRNLLGYYVHRKFHIYLESVVGALRRQYEEGLSEGLTQPTPLGRKALLDIRALDFNALIEMIGAYLYVLACHKGANWRLMHRNDAKQVLYLRGYDFEAAFQAGGGLAAGISTMDTEGFTLTLPARLQRGLFKVLSPMEVDWETVTAERYYGDLDAMIQWISRRPAAIYLNALHWKQGVLKLIPRMDHFIVYVSSLTESALWELDQLHDDRYRGRVTVVFDEKAIGKKASQLALQQAMVGRLGKAIWSKQGGPPTLTPTQVRSGLAEVFTVMSPEEFEANIDAVRQRIDNSHAELVPGERETWLDFEFYPAVPENDLTRLRQVSQALAELVDAGQIGSIDCLPLYVAQIQLRIYLTLLLGDHAATGRALAAYSAVMQSAFEHSVLTDAQGNALPEAQQPVWLGMLDSHGGFSEYIGRRLLAYGRSHEFSNQSDHADATWDMVFNATRKAVDNIYAGCQRPTECA